MIQSDDKTLVLHLIGRLGKEESAAIERQRERDPELATKLQFMADFTGLTPDAFRPSPVLRAQARVVTKRSWRALRRHPVALILLFVGAFAGAAGAGWTLFFPRALLRDDFNDNWFDSRLWTHPPAFGKNQGVRETDGHLKLINRGYLVSKREFSGPIELSFDWRWSELGLNPVYADHLVVVLRSSGNSDPKYPFEIEDGVKIRFNAWSGEIELMVEPGRKFIQSTESGAAKFPSETWHHVRITDDGERVQVFFNTVDQARSDAEPLIEGSFPTTKPSGHIVFYNRESVADVPHESCIDNVLIRAVR